MCDAAHKNRHGALRVGGGSLAFDFAGLGCGKTERNFNTVLSLSSIVSMPEKRNGVGAAFLF